MERRRGFARYSPLGHIGPRPGGPCQPGPGPPRPQEKIMDFTGVVTAGPARGPTEWVDVCVQLCRPKELHVIRYRRHPRKR